MYRGLSTYNVLRIHGSLEAGDWKGSTRPIREQEVTGRPRNTHLGSQSNIYVLLRSSLARRHDTNPYRYRANLAAAILRSQLTAAWPLYSQISTATIISQYVSVICDWL